MAEGVKFLEFEGVEGAPRIKFSADASPSQIQDYLKSEKFEAEMFGQGWRYKYGLKPVNMLLEHNTDDGSATAGFKQTWDWVKSAGMNTVAALNDLFGNKEGQESAMKIAEQYLLDQSAHIFQKDENGVILPRITTVEQILEDENQLAAFGKYVKHTMGSAAASTSIPFLTAAVGGAAGSIIPGVGTVAGTSAGFLLGSYIFGVGDTYQAQKEGGADDPNAMLSLALGVPYAYIEKLGIGRIPNALARTFGSPKAAKEALQQNLFYKLNKKAVAPNFKKVPGMFVKSMGKYGMEEALAESLQETITRSAEGIAGDYDFDQMFNNKEFAKQLGEAAAGGFFGGWGFGVFTPAANTIKMLGQAGGQDLEGGGEWSQVNVAPNQEAFKGKGWQIGDTVEALNKFNLEADLPLFDKPKFTMAGTAVLKDTPHYILQSIDMPGVIETIPVTDGGYIYKVDPPKGGGEAGEDPAQNYIYETTPDKEHKWYDKDLQKQYNETKKKLHQTGWIDKNNNESIDSMLGGKDRVVNDVANEIEFQRSEQIRDEKNITADERKELENEGIPVDRFITALDSKYKKYDGLTGDELKQAIAKDYNYWRAETVLNDYPDENKVTPDEELSLQKLGYNIGALGTDYKHKLISDLTPTNDKGKVVSPTSKNAVSTRGRDRLKEIHDNQISFSTIPEDLGGPQQIEMVIGEEVSSIKRPLTAEEVASLTGDKIVPVMRYNPILMKEGMSFEDLYTLSISDRMRMVFTLAHSLDHRGWKNLSVKKIYPYIQSTLRELETYAKVAALEYGINSATAKQALQDVKDFKDKGNHILRADMRMGDIETTFRLQPIFTPAAIRQAERTIAKLKRDSKFRSTKPEVKGKIDSEILAYESLIKSTINARRQLNELLKSMSIEPITDWETVTYQKILQPVGKLRNDINRKQTDVKKKKIKSYFTKLQIGYAGRDPEPGLNTEFTDNLLMVTQMMREYLNRIGLGEVDLAVMRKIISRMELSAGQQVPAAFMVAGREMGMEALESMSSLLQNKKNLQDITERIDKYSPQFPFNMIKVAFDMDTFEKLDTNYDRAKYFVNAMRTLQHESIHAFKAMGMFTAEEWKILSQESIKPGGFIDKYDIKKRYKGMPRDILIEEGIAEAFSAYAKGIQNPYNTRIKQVFARIKSFLLSLISALQGRGFHTPESIFDAVQAGLIAKRNSTRVKIADLNSSKEVDSITLQNPSGTIVMTNNLLDTPANKVYQTRMMENMLGESLMTKQKFDNLLKQGYMQKGAVPPVESTIVYTEGDGTRRQGGPEGTVVPPLDMLEGRIFEHYRLEKLAELLDEQIRMAEQGQASTISADARVIRIGKPKKDKVFDREVGALFLDLREQYDRTALEYETNRQDLNNMLMRKENLEKKLFGNVEGIKAIDPEAKLLSVKFSNNINKIKWANKYMSDKEGMGALSILEPYSSMYTYMTPAQFLDLVPKLDRSDPYYQKSTKSLAQGIKDGKAVGLPYVVIELSDDGFSGRVVTHEGRHRTHIIETINGPSSNMPVAIEFKTPTQSNAFEKGRGKRDDPMHKKMVENFIQRGVLINQSENSRGPARDVINKVFQSFEQLDSGEFNFGDEYIDSPNAYVKFQLGYASDSEQDMNRAEDRQTNRDIEKNGENSLWPDKEFTQENMSAFSKFLGHARAWAKKNTPFTFLYNTVMNTLRKTRMLQQDYTQQLARRYLPIMRDPVMSELITKAMIIAEMNGALPQANEQDQLIFVAPKDGGAADMPVKEGEVIVLEGDVAGAFMDHRQTMIEINNEFLKSKIASDHIPDLVAALQVIKRYNPQLPEFQTIFNFQGLSKEEISARLEPLNYTQIKYINDQLGAIINALSIKKITYRGRDDFIGPSADAFRIMEITNLLGTKDKGLMNLQDIAGKVATRNKGAYVPLMRFGDWYISVKDPSRLDEKGKPATVWYQQFNSRNEALEARDTLRLKFPEGDISQPGKVNIDELKQRIREGVVTLEQIAQYITDTNSKNYASLMKEMREHLAEKGADKDVMGINQFFAERDKSVGVEGVPGYSADFTRSTMQYIAIASNILARNRYAKDKYKFYYQTLEYARGRKNAAGKSEPDVNLEIGTRKYMQYTEDPTQEFSILRRMGFWYYLGGNLSSAILQTMSLFQFSGPLISMSGGTILTSKEMAKAMAHVSTMVFRGGVMGQGQYQDAFIDFNKLPDDVAGIKKALQRAIADGTIKQGQALQEAGIVPGVVGSINMPEGSQQKRSRIFRTFENVIVGGAFNTVEAASRLTAFITAYNVAMKNPDALKKADILYGDDQEYQLIKKEYGNTAEAYARFMTEETFGVYGKENRQQLGRQFGSLAALFMTYVSQMMGLYYRMLNPYVIKKTPEGFRIGISNPNKTAAQNRIGRRAFAKMMLMMLMTGGLFALPFTEDAEDLYNLVKKQITGVDGDVRAEFRAMLFEAGFGPQMIEAMESGLIEAFFNIDVQRRLGFGVAPWSQQVRAGLNVAGINTGAKAEEFLGAPGSVFIDVIRSFGTDGMREGNWSTFTDTLFPTAVRNLRKAWRYSPLGDGYAATGYGNLLADNLTGMELLWQTIGFTPTRIAKERESLYLEKKIDRGSNAKRTQFNARLTNAYVEIIQGGLQDNSERINEGQQAVADLIADLIEFNSKQPPHLQIQLDIKRLRQEAMMMVYTNYRLIKKNKETYWIKKNNRLSLGLD